MDWYWWLLIAVGVAGFSFFSWCLCAVSDRLGRDDD